MSKRGSPEYNKEARERGMRAYYANPEIFRERAKREYRRHKAAVAAGKEPPRECTSVEHNVWACIVQRCTNPNGTGWPNYGGRGIKVCDAWRWSYPQFLKDMGRRPGPGYHIDRIDNDGDYEPSNCQWLTAKENSRKTRRCVMLTFKGETMCVSAWAERLGVNKDKIRGRLRRGWSVEDALTVEPCSPGYYHVERWN